MTTEYKSNYDLTHPVTQENAAVLLAAATEDNFTVAGTKEERYIAIFEYESNSDVFVAVNQTAALPSAGTIDYPSTSMFKPKKLYLRGTDVVSFISSAAVYCGVSLYLYKG